MDVSINVQLIPSPQKWVSNNANTQQPIFLTDEDGNFITDENGNRIVIDQGGN